MKKYLIAFLIVFVAVACWQCGDKGEDDPAPDPKIEITGSPEGTGLSLLPPMWHGARK